MPSSHSFKAFLSSDCIGRGQLYPHPWCVLCGNCLQEGCSFYKRHDPIDLRESTPLPPSERTGHPRFYELLDTIAELHSKKNKDYASGMKEGPLGNFSRVAKIKQLYPGFDWDSPFGVCFSYILKQFDAALKLRSMKQQSVVGEGIGERLKDVATYVLIAIVLEEEEHKS